MSLRQENISNLLNQSSLLRREIDVTVRRIISTTTIRSLKSEKYETQVATITATSSIIAVANTNRICLLIYNNSNQWPIYVGNSLVTSANGIPINIGKEREILYSSEAIYGVCAAGQTAEIRYVEL
jgi:hypothetical protein